MARQDISENTREDMLPSVVNHICDELYRRIVVSAIDNILASIRLDGSGAFADKTASARLLAEMPLRIKIFWQNNFFGKINKVWYINNC